MPLPGHQCIGLLLLIINVLHPPGDYIFQSVNFVGLYLFGFLTKEKYYKPTIIQVTKVICDFVGVFRFEKYT